MHGVILAGILPGVWHGPRQSDILRLSFPMIVAGQSGSSPSLVVAASRDLVCRA